MNYCTNERIEYKLLSVTYKTLATAQPSYLHSLISVQPPRATRSSSVVGMWPRSRRLGLEAASRPSNASPRCRLGLGLQRLGLRSRLTRPR